jgi:hypothetical protein
LKLPFLRFITVSVIIYFFLCVMPGHRGSDVFCTGCFCEICLFSSSSKNWEVDEREAEKSDMGGAIAHILISDARYGFAR